LTPEQERFLQEWEASLAGLRDEVRELGLSAVAKTDALAGDVTIADANSAYRRIEDRAKALVSKAGDGLTHDEAVARVLEQDPALYDAYIVGLAKAQAGTVATAQDELQAARDLVAWAESRLQQVSDPDQLRNELLSDPQVLAAYRLVQADTERRERAARSVEKAAPKQAQGPPTPKLPRGSSTGLPFRSQLRKSAPAKPRSDDDVQRELHDLLDIPHPSEGAILDEVRKDGGDASTESAVSMALRLIAGVSGDLSHETAVALRETVTRRNG
jgi:hypothetical protein